MLIHSILILALCLPSLSAQAAVIHGEKGSGTTFLETQNIDTALPRHLGDEELTHDGDDLLSGPTGYDSVISTSELAISAGDANFDEPGGDHLFAIPEPAAAALGILGFIMILRRRR